MRENTPLKSISGYGLGRKGREENNRKREESGKEGEIICEWGRGERGG